jgi:LacI family transcriptional regulator
LSGVRKPASGDGHNAPVRIKDIADDLGVSVAAVSRALRNRGEISSEMRALVLKRAAELNYRPNLTARALVTGRSNLIGLVVPALVHPFFAELATALSAALRRSGFNLVIASADEDPELEREEIDRLVARGVDALLVASTQETPETFRSVLAQNIPCVLLDRWFEGLSANFVGVDDEKVGAMATEHLLDIGCSCVAHISGTGVSTSRGRLVGYTKTLAQHGIPFREEYCVSVQHLDSSAVSGGYAATAKLLQCNPRPDGIFCCNDPMAIGAMQAIAEIGLTVPDDIALIGCGNLHYDNALQVPLSSIDQRSEALGERAAQLALRLIEARAPIRPKVILLEPSLVVRKSTDRTRLRLVESLARETSDKAS